jgi:hypothetical protein
MHRDEVLRILRDSFSTADAKTEAVKSVTEAIKKSKSTKRKQGTDTPSADKEQYAFVSLPVLWAAASVAVENAVSLL